MSWTPKAIKSWMNSDVDIRQTPVQNKTSALSKSQQVFGQAVHGLVNDGNFRELQLVKSVYKKHASSPVSMSLSMDNPDGDFSTIEQKSKEKRVRTTSGDSQASVEEELTFLRKKVEEHESSMESLKLTMLSLREESTCQKQCIERVEKRFHGHRVLIDRTLQQTQLALQDQQEILCRQEVLVKKLENERRLGGSVFVESIHILFGMYVIQTPLVKYTIQLISMRLDKHGRQRNWLPRFLQIMFFMQFVKLCKSCDSYFGLSSGIWSLFSRMSEGLQSIMTRITNVKPYSAITYSSTPLKEWNRYPVSTVGLNSLGQNVDKETEDNGGTTAKSLNVC